MAKRLKLSLMIHIEEGTRWNQTDALQTVDARRIGALASIVGGGSRGAKLSLQMDYPFVDCSDVVVSTPYSAPSSLRWVTDHGGNFWCHTHDSSYNHLTSVQRTVASAYAAEAGYSYPTALNLVSGRSRRPDMIDPAPLRESPGGALNRTAGAGRRPLAGGGASPGQGGPPVEARQGEPAAPRAGSPRVLDRREGGPLGGTTR